MMDDLITLNYRYSYKACTYWKKQTKITADVNGKCKTLIILIQIRLGLCPHTDDKKVKSVNQRCEKTWVKIPDINARRWERSCVSTLRQSERYSRVVLASIFEKWRTFNIFRVSTWVRADKVRQVERSGEGGGSLPLSVRLLQNVTGKIGKAFNVMQYLSNHPIKIKPNQSLRADRHRHCTFTLCCWTSQCLWVFASLYTAHLFW